MKNILKLFLIICLLINTVYAEPLSAGSSISSSGSEESAVVKKVREQIQELNRGIMHGAPQFSMVGQITKSGNQYFINGDSFTINKDTIIHGDLKSDSYVEVRGYLIQGKPKIAKQITVAEVTNTAPSPNSSNADTNLK